MILNIEDDAREQIALILPDALRVALNDYQDFLTRPPESDESNAKKHGERQDALRKQLAYIQLILKTAALLNLPDAKGKNPNHQIMLSVLMQEAQEEVKANDDLDGEDDV